MQIQTVYTPGMQAKADTYHKFITREDLSLPIAAKQPLQDIRVKLDNRAMMEVRIIQGKRAIITFFVETLTKDEGRSAYRRLRQRAVTLSVGSTAEAERAIDAVLAFAMSLDGKHLAANEIANPPANSSESASEPQSE